MLTIKTKQIKHKRPKEPVGSVARYCITRLKTHVDWEKRQRNLTMINTKEELI